MRGRLNGFVLAHRIQKFLARSKSAGYSHPPIRHGDNGRFRVTHGDGRVFEVSVREVTPEEQILEAHMTANRAKGGDD